MQIVMTDDSVIERVETILYLPTVGQCVAGCAVAPRIGLEPDDVKLIGANGAARAEEWY